MTGRVIPLHQSLRHLPAPGRLLTLEEVQAEMERPPAVPVSWRVFTLVPRREVTVVEQRWFDARLLGALKLGLVPERVSCVRADEVRIEESQESELSGNQSA